MAALLERECNFCSNMVPEKETYCDECGMDLEEETEEKERQ